MRSFKGLDMYRKVSTDHTQQTYKGGILTLIVGSLMVFLFFSEFQVFTTHEILKETVISQESSMAQVRVNLDVSLPRSPCMPVSLDQQDDVNKHILDSSDHLKKIRLNKYGEEIGTQFDRTVDELKKALDNEEGCRIKGYILVSKLPGNFHISYHVAYNLIQALNPEYKNKLKLDHIVHNLSVGDEDITHLIESEFGASEILSVHNQTAEDLPQNTKHEYFMKIIPVEFINECSDQVTNTYQFSFIYSKSSMYGFIPAIYFRYDFENISMRYTKVDKKLMNFIVSMCAILGGFFTISGIINKLIN